MKENRLVPRRGNGKDLGGRRLGNNELAERLGPFWSAEKVCGALGGCSLATLGERCTNGTLLGLRTTDGVTVYPVVQFETAAGSVRVKPGLVPFLEALRDTSPWEVALLLHAPAAELDDHSPLDWLRHGHDPRQLETYAQSLAPSLSR